MPARLTFATLAAALALALPSAALALPSTPNLHQVPSTVTVWPGASTLNVAWDPSLLDPGALAGLYQVKINAYPNASSTPSTSTHLAGCCTYALPLVTGYHYVVAVRASEWIGCSLLCSISWSFWRSTQFDVVSPAAGEIVP